MNVKELENLFNEFKPYNRSNIFLRKESIKQDCNNDIITFIIDGGLNGANRWENYFEDMSKLVKLAFSLYSATFNLIIIETDTLDDIFYAKFAVSDVSQDEWY